MIEQNNNLDINTLITEAFDKTRIKISEKDPLFTVIYLNQKILDITLNKLAESNSVISEKVTDDLLNKLEVLKSEINKLPDAIDQKTADLREAAIALHDEFQQSKGEVKGSIEEARENATKRLSEIISEISLEVKNVAGTANSAIKEINKNAEEVINHRLNISLEKHNQETSNITKKLDNAIRHAFEKSTKKLMTICGIALFFSTVLQLGIWGWFIWKLSH
ncbi:hypothetical protein SLX97_004498 [Salmonella enterica]|nr:hypothetical protein [Salmonella enterica]ELY1197702.1 hypothetical protein [Salmonella enterica]